MEKLNFKNLQNKIILTQQKIVSAKSSADINLIIEEFVSSLVDAEFVSLWFYDQKNLKLVRERQDAKLREIPLKDVKRGVIYKCFMTKEGGIYNYLASEKDYVASVDNPDNIKIKSKIILPLLQGEKLIGIVTAYTSIKKAKKFTQQDMKILESIAPFLINVLCKIHDLDICVSNAVVQKKVLDIETEEKNTKQNTTEEDMHVMANFIHDIRTPANTLQGFLELLEEKIDDKELKGYLHNAKESAGFINDLTTSMLGRIKMRVQRTTATTQEIQCLQFFRSIADMFLSNMHKKNIGFNVFIDPMMPKSIEVDALKLKRTLMNLLSNAYKFTPTGKNIEFSIVYNVETKKLHFSINDEGIGIAPEKQEEIFEAFKQAEETTSLKYGGTGLGLSICAEYVHDLGGKLQIKSELEKGSQFYFEITPKEMTQDTIFPAITNKNVKITIVMQENNDFSVMNITRYLVRLGIEKENITTVSKVENISKETTNLIVFQHFLTDSFQELLLSKNMRILVVEEELFSLSAKLLPEGWDFIPQYGSMLRKIYKFININKIPKVLIVDDDQISTVLLEKILEKEYCEVESTNDGRVALDMLIASHKKGAAYDIVYIDSKMPSMSGEEVVRELRKFEQENNMKHIYTVSISGNVTDSNSEIGKEYDICVGKPFKNDEIRRVLHEKF